MKHIIQAPVVTEKTSMREANSVYTFKVGPTATKLDVTREFLKLFGDAFPIEKVRIANVIKKARKLGRNRMLTKRKAYKRATIYLKKGTVPLDITKLSV